MKDLGVAKKIQGMEILIDISQKKIFLSQKGYIHKELATFVISSTKSIDTTSAADLHLIMFIPQFKEEHKNVLGSYMQAQ